MATREVEVVDPPREVRIRFTVKRLINVDLQAQAFTAIVQLEARWVDDELASIATRMGRGIHELRVDEARSDQLKGVAYVEGDAQSQPLFAPRLEICNKIHSEEEASWWKVHTSEEYGERKPIVRFSWLLTGVFQEQFELGWFPIDAQALTIQLSSGWECSHKTNGVLLVKNQNEKYKSVCNTSNFVQGSEYRLYERLRFTALQTDRAASHSNQVYSLIHISMRIDRKSFFWVLNVLLPLFIVTTSLFASFAVPVDEFGDRCSVSLTLLLAMVAFKYTISEKLPNISYATLIDKYVVCCFLVAFCVILVQTFSAVGLIEELFWQTRMYNVSELGAADWQEGLVSSRANTKVPFLMVVLGGLWLLLHVVAMAVIAVVKLRNSTGAYWKAPRASVWLGPICWKDAQGRDAADAAVRGLMEEFGKVLDVNLWTADDARQCLAAAHTKPPEPYRGQSNFAIVRFATEEDASRAVADFDSEECKRRCERLVKEGALTSSTDAGHLNAAFFALTMRNEFEHATRRQKASKHPPSTRRVAHIARVHAPLALRPPPYDHDLERYEDNQSQSSVYCDPSLRYECAPASPRYSK